jgi:hypothetical protein
MFIILSLWLVNDCEVIHNHPRIWLWCGAWDLLWVVRPGASRAYVFLGELSFAGSRLI